MSALQQAIVPFGPDPLQSVPICVVSSNQLVRRFLCNLLHADVAFHPLPVAGFARNVSAPLKPIFVVDCASLDLPLGEFLRRLRSRFPDCRCVLVDKPQSATEIAAKISYGVEGYLEHESVESTLLEAVRAVNAGRLWIPQRVPETHLRVAGRTECTRRGPIEPITPRETQVLELIRRRLSNKEIASLLRVRESTIKYHVSNILGKLQLRNRYQIGQMGSAPDPLADML